MYPRSLEIPSTGRQSFFLFDAGVYRTIRPTGPLDSPGEIDGPSLETLVYQELRAAIAYRSLKLAAGVPASTVHETGLADARRTSQANFIWSICTFCEARTSETSTARSSSP